MANVNKHPDLDTILGKYPVFGEGQRVRFNLGDATGDIEAFVDKASGEWTLNIRCRTGLLTIRPYTSNLVALTVEGE